MARPAFLTVLLALLFLPLVPAAPLQYCHLFPATTKSQPSTLCFALATTPNITHPDIHLTLTHTRTSRTPNGWTAVGLGSTMASALMLIIYGDPSSHAPPTLSIRTTTAHNPPMRPTLPAFDIRVLTAAWVPALSAGPEASSATFTLTCFACALGDDRAAIWAHNPTQTLADFGPDTALQQHTQGHGVLQLDLEAAGREVGAGAPPVVAGAPNVGVVEADPRAMARNRLWHLHGALMTTAFLGLLPLGVVAVRGGARGAFRAHWVLQLGGAGVAGLGIGVGFLVSRRMVLVHQYMGLGVGVLLAVQMGLGYWHHVVFGRRGRTWVSDAHVWVGRLLLLGGWVEAVWGVAVLRQYGWLVVLGLIVAVLGEGVGLVWWVRRAGVRRAATAAAVGVGMGGRSDGHAVGEEYFALVGEGEEGEQEGEQEERGEM